MSENPASPSAPSVLAAPWVHRSAAGVEIGGEVPSGAPMGALRAFASAVKEAWSVREILGVLVVRDFKARYRAQALGLFWSFAHPLIMMVTISVAFKYILKVNIDNFQIFYLVGSVIWQYANNSILATTGSMVDNAGLIKRTTFPRFLFPISTILSHLILLGMEMSLVFAFFFVYPEAYNFNASLLALPLLLVLLIIMLVGIGLTTCGLNVKYRDLYYLVTSFLTVLFWITPVIFKTDMAPDWLQPFFHLNPIGCVIEGAREIIMFGRWPGLSYVGPAAITAVVVFVVGCFVFRRQNLHIADYV